MMRPDTYRHKGLRRQMVQQLRQRGIEHEALLEAMYAVPRHYFLPAGMEDLAYQQDRALPIGLGQTISQPYTVAYQTQLLGVRSGMRILEIGTGSGYQTSILAAMGAQVFSVERHEALCVQARQRLEELKLQAEVLFGDGYAGLPHLAPFDGVLITAAAPEPPPVLLRQLRIGGVMVVPVSEQGDAQVMCRVVRETAREFHRFDYERFRFVPMLSGKNPLAPD